MEPPFHEIHKDKPSKLCAILTEILPLGAKLRYMGYFASLLHPQEETPGYYFHSGTCLVALETHV